jgi:hypothetical protein
LTVRTAGNALVALCILAGVALIGWGLVQENGESKFLDKAAKAIGEVTAIQTSGIDEQTNSYCAIVTFNPPKGGPVSFTDTVCGSSPLQRVGDKVPVLYDPDGPTVARIAQGGGPWAVALPFFGWAALAWLAAGIAQQLVKRFAR